MYIGMLSIGEGRGGGKERGTFLIKEQWEKSLLSSHKRTMGEVSAIFS